ncbi:MAG: hypothetical protein AAF065_11170 [Verrucomicrobiota bacterium]
MKQQILIISLALVFTTSTFADESAEMAELRALVKALSEENSSLKQQLSARETKLEKQEEELEVMKADQREARREQREFSGSANGRERGPGGLIQLGPVSIGGALRANYTVGDYDNPALDGDILGPGRDGDGGTFTLDTFYVNASLEEGNFIGQAEYRFYDQLDELGGYNFIHTLWGGYRFNDGSELKVGVVEVPFGLERFGNSYGFFNSLENIVGLSDDRDLGAVYSLSWKDFDIDLGYFYGEEPNGNGQSANSARGSYDIINTSNANLLAQNNFLNGNFSPFRERDQFNVRVKYNFYWGDFENVVGASLQYGNLEATDDRFDDGDATAGSIFLKSTYGNWQLKAGVTKYHYDTDTLKDPLVPLIGFNPDQIVVGAFDIPIFIASEGTIPSFGLSYTHIPRNIDFIDWIVPYIDYSIILKDGETNGQYYFQQFVGTEFQDSEQFTLGAIVGMGDFIIYIDTVFGKGSPLIGNETGQLLFGGALNDSLSAVVPFDDSWQTRFNINVGYYF